MIGLLYFVMAIYYMVGIRLLLKETWEDSFYSGMIWPIWIYENTKLLLKKWPKN
jgi:hypothetical protein